MTSQQDISGLILAGGAGLRMGGRDKGLVPWQGKPLIEHVIHRLEPQVGPLLISCNRNFDLYEQFGALLVRDKREGYQGPLAGLEAAASQIHTEFLVAVTCDAPKIPPDLVDRLILPFTQTAIGSLDVCYAHDGQRKQYLCAAFRCACLPSIKQFLDKGHRAVHHWYEELNTCSVDFSDTSGAFFNHNTDR